MQIQLSLSAVNWLSVIVATLLSFGIGGLWYSAVLFGKSWQKECKLTDEELKNANMLMIFGTTFVLEFIAALFLDVFLGTDATMMSGIKLAAVVSLVWISTSFGVNYLFARKSLKLFLIDAGYYFVYFIVMGAIIGAW
jgi:hypothetical protein